MTIAERIRSKCEALGALGRHPIAFLVAWRRLPGLHRKITRDGLTPTVAALRLARPVQPAVSRRRHDAFAVARLARVIGMTARLQGIRDRSCVARSLLLWDLCARRGIEVCVRLGADAAGVRSRPETDAPFHAWVEFAGEPVGEHRDLATQFHAFAEPLIGERS